MKIVMETRDYLIAQYGSQADFLHAVQSAEEDVEAEEGHLRDLKLEDADPADIEAASLDVLEARTRLEELRKVREGANW
jgi:hypothetical protein